MPLQNKMVRLFPSKYVVSELLIKNILHGPKSRLLLCKAITWLKTTNSLSYSKNLCLTGSELPSLFF